MKHQTLQSLTTSNADREYQVSSKNSDRSEMIDFISSSQYEEANFVPLDSEIQYFKRKRGKNTPKRKDNINPLALEMDI